MSRAFYVTNTPHLLRFLNSIYQFFAWLYYGKKVHPDDSDITLVSSRSSQCTWRWLQNERYRVLDLFFAIKRRSCESEYIYLNGTIANYEVCDLQLVNLRNLNSHLIRDEMILKSAASVGNLNSRLYVSYLEKLIVSIAWNDFTVLISTSSAVSRSSLNYLTWWLILSGESRWQCSRAIVNIHKDRSNLCAVIRICNIAVPVWI